MSSQSTPVTVHSVGPYHGLSSLPENAKGLTAIVAGANGISGQHLLSVLLGRPDVWTKIYALSRSAPPKNSPAADRRMKHIPVDFLAGKDVIAQKLSESGVKWGGDSDIYAFYMAYKEHSQEGLWSGQKEMWDDNGAMFEGFLGALGKGVKRIVLQTGGKYYGVHFGEVANPMSEDQPRIDYGPWKDIPNFYYRQEDALVEYCKAHPGTTYATTRPANIIGSVANNFMNEAITLFLYIIVSLELNPDTPPIFPGTFAKYHTVEQQTSAQLMGYFDEWIALSPTAANQHFNSVNGDNPTWARLWPSVLSRFNIEAAPFGTEDISEEWKGRKTTSSIVAPIDGKRKNEYETRVSLVKWSKDEKIVKAWERLRDREGLEQKVWEGASWAFADGMLGGQFPVVLAMEKARERGWFGTVRAEEDWGVVLERAREQGILPRGN